MKRNKKSINVLFLGMFIALVVIAIAGMNMRTLINSNGLMGTARKAGANDATRGDVLENYTFTSDTEGIGVAGSITDYSQTLNQIKLEASAANKTVTIPLNPGYYTQINIDTTDVYEAGVSATKVGTATAGNVLSGKTFTNSSTVGETGTMTNYGYEPTASSVGVYNNNLYMGLPDNTNPNPFPGGYMASGIKYPLSNFGNVTTAGVLSGKTFTSSAGMNVGGTMTNYGTEPTASSSGVYNKNLYMGLPDKTSANPFPGGYIVGGIKYPLSNFGNVTAEDVTEGKTFTSSAGLKVTGTWKRATYVGHTVDLNSTSDYYTSTNFYSKTKIQFVDGVGTAYIYDVNASAQVGALLNTITKRTIINL